MKKKETKKQVKELVLTIAYPSRGVCDPAFAQALRNLQVPFPFTRYETNFVPGADVAVARNLLAEKSIGDYILFLDDDVLPPMNALVKLFLDGKDIVTGLYFAKQEPHFPQIFKKGGDKDHYDCVENYQKDSLFEVDACGGGCMLVKKSVFKKIRKPYFQYIAKGEDTPRKGEDFFFREKAKEAGFKIYCDSRVVCRHIGTKVIGPQHWEISLEHLALIKEKLGLS